MSVERKLTGYRYVEILHGDTLQAIAARELSDAARWPDIVAINGLAPPYLTADPALAGERVKLFGQLLLVPAVTIQASSEADPGRVFKVDIALNRGRLGVANGDLALVAGRENLRQALNHRVETPLRELTFHWSYGCGVHDVKGRINGPTRGVLAAEYAKGAVLADPRIREVSRAVAVVAGDQIQVEVTAHPIDGTSIDILTTV